jgi:hypothetical protein
MNLIEFANLQPGQRFIYTCPNLGPVTYKVVRRTKTTVRARNSECSEFPFYKKDAAAMSFDAPEARS